MQRSGGGRITSMLFNLGVQHGERYLIVVASGKATVADLCGAASLGAVTARLSGLQCVLVDLLGVDQSLSVDEHLRLGAHLAEAARGLQRVAIVVPAAQRVGIGEQAAREQGLKLRTFSALDEAHDWLAQA